METAKVDIRKLQLLNDRINQCIDALNQVRLSVHGLSHTSATAGLGGGINPFAAGVNPFAPNPTVGFAPYGAPPFASPGFMPGISHSTWGPQAFPGAIDPRLDPRGATLPFAGHIPSGLSHTTLEGEGYARPTWADPYLAAKIAQTFPYAQYAVPPVVTIY
jgi:hypothetical protein